MSSKTSNASPDSTATTLLAQFPPRLSLSSQLLGSVIPLPPNPVIAYSVYTAQDAHAVELARRKVYRLRKPSIVESLLTSVRILKDRSAIHVFAITSEDMSESHKDLEGLGLDGLELTETSKFAFQSIYSCSASCNSSPAPCPSCLNPSNHRYPFPGRPARQLLSQFTQAIQERLIDDVAEASRPGRPVKRYRNGFLLGPAESPGEWSAGWEQYARCRPLIFCHLQLHLTGTSLVIQPVLKPTLFHPLPFYLPVSCTVGSPITLLPYGTPAYYLTTYSGSTSMLTSQFESALAGLGAGDWSSSPPYASNTQRPGGHFSKAPTYIIACVGVQNKQGEDKGITVIWPARLALAFHPSAISSRQSLSYLPELPTELQPSPPPPASPAYAPPLEGEPSFKKVDLVRPICPSLTRSGAYTSTAHSFRTLAVTKSKDVNDIASEVGGYVDTVVKEREKERERWRKDRESSQMQTLSPAVGAATPKAPSATPAAVVQEDTPIFPENSPGMEDSPMAVDRELLQPPDTSPMEVDAVISISPPAPTLEVSDPVPEEIMPTTRSVSPTSNTFDSYTWGSSAGDYMSFGGAGPTGELNMTFSVGDGFDDFTEDDFNFFDRPDPAPPPLPTSTIEPIFAAQVGPMSASPWTAADVLTSTPGFVSGGAGDAASVPPELDPPSPGATPSAYSDPATPPPTIQLMEGTPSRQLLLGVPGIFEPIPFAPNHRATDEKYAMGKFAVLSSPGKDLKDDDMLVVCAVRPGLKDKWRQSYDAITDPRVSVVRQLIGVKRKSIEQGMRDMKLSPSWVQEPDDWIPCTPEAEEEEADEDGESEEDELWMDEDPEDPSRPSTPPPSYLPLGPTLLETHFQHFQLLPVSSALRSPGAATSLAVPPPPMLSVPTPVSPAAALAATSEKSKSLEAAAHMFARELVENPIWARGCRDRAVNHAFEADVPTEVWQNDASHVAQLMSKSDGSKAVLELRELFAPAQGTTKDTESSTIQALSPPLLTVSKSNAVIQVRPPVLRFWEKLGLAPRSGNKDVSAFVFFEDEGEARLQQVERWLSKLSLRYNAKGLGRHQPAAFPGCVKAGLIPIKFDAIRKALVNFVSMLDANAFDNIVFYVLTPSSIMTLSSSVLRQIFSAAKRTVKAQAQRQILFHLVPEYLASAGIDDWAHGSSLDSLAMSVYDRILTPVDRLTARPDIEQMEPRRSYIQEPAFVLARPLRNSLHFEHKPHIHNLDVVDRHTLLHVGYQITKCGKWLVAATMDQRGEAHDVCVWLVKEDVVVAQVWNFLSQMARRASVEWRMVVTKLGTMGESELQAWASHLQAAATEPPDIPLHVTLLAATHGPSWTFLAPDRKPSKSVSPQRSSPKDNHPILLDVSFTTYALYPEPRRLPMLSPLPDFRSDPSIILEPFESCRGDEDGDSLAALPQLSTALITVPAGTDYTSIEMLSLHLLYSTDPDTAKETLKDVTNNFYELTVLAQARGLEGMLPLHLAMLERVGFGGVDGDVVE
ncbi:hypothetical protein OE88DRAFT_1652968 [Heliocybe sulcata]|uniref:Mediator of RNA polymerase II transcription subunit 13 n=1 Tax=Heliocybe sulcata TaxID=5364 RepID=A0A5C3NG03_9AGAM|nr:hypothetical protein OE88DRAFT_1652968 [Heliocybe sulcata]